MMIWRYGFLLSVLALIAGADDFSWVPAEAMGSDKAVQGGSSDRADVPVVYTKIPKKTAKISRFRKKYTIDLKKFGISNDGTNPEATAKGINAALQHAKKIGMNHIVFPKGTYLVSEKIPIVFDHKDTVVDLNGATLQVNTNASPKYSIIKIVEGAENFRLTNGTLRGDKDTHRYRGSHDGGCAITLTGGRELELDHLTITNVTGSGVASSSAMGRGSAPFHRVYVYDGGLEQGAFSEQGVKIASKVKTRSIKPYNISRHAKEGEMEFGYIAGYQGFPCVKGRQYQAYFFTKDMTFIAKVNCLQYKKVKIPEDSVFVHLEFNQPEVKKGPAGSGHITNLKPPREVHFHHNHLLGNRALGMAFCGGQQWIIEHNFFEGNGPKAPGYGIDFEDGWLLMQNVVFRYNKFKGNKRGDLVVCSGSELIFEGNEFERGVHFWSAILSYTFCNNKVKGGTIGFGTRTGMVNLYNNVYENCAIKLEYDGRGMNNGVYRADQPEKGIGGTVEPTEPITFLNETLINVSGIHGPYIDLDDCSLKSVKLVAGPKTGLVRLRKCTLEDSSVEYSAGDSKIYVAIDSCQGELKETGSGTDRKNVVSKQMEGPALRP